MKTTFPAEFATTGDIAEALSVSKQAVHRRSNKEHWPFEQRAVRGGQGRLYRLADLPRMVTRKVATRRAVLAIKEAQQTVPETFVVVVDGEVFEVRRLPA